jgi:hypothetical protein
LQPRHRSALLALFLDWNLDASPKSALTKDLLGISSIKARPFNRQPTFPWLEVQELVLGESQKKHAQLS